MSKGSKRRERQISEKEFIERWENTFHSGGYVMPIDNVRSRLENAKEVAGAELADHVLGGS